jgi:hypothetical protein
MRPSTAPEHEFMHESERESRTASAARTNAPDPTANDARWQLAQRIIASRHFARSPLLSRFLLHIVWETVEDRSSQITEHQIGVRVFDRPATYRTVEDNIVRNYARQLRRRLADYFADEGASEPLQIDIPLGGYVPVFVPRTDADPHQARPTRTVPIAIRTQPSTSEVPLVLAGALSSNRRRWLMPLLFVAYTAVLVVGVWFAATRTRIARQTYDEPALARPLWAALFDGSAPTYIVPADAGLNLLEDLSHRPVTLANYIDGGYAQLTLPSFDPHSADDLRTQHFTSFVDLQIIASLTRLPEFNPQRAILRFPRDLRLDDLRNANAVIIGSVGSNPWASIAEANANFRIEYRAGMQSATIVNSRPQAGESPTYVSHWDEPAHETFALIAFLPNLAGSGRLLLLEGLDVAGTQAAAEAIFHPDAMDAILHRATRPDGSLRPFEILLRSTSIHSSATGTRIIGTRVY